MMSKTIGKKNRARRRDRVTKLLDNVDYGIDNSYVPTEFSLMFINFIKLVNGQGGEEHPSPVMHSKMLDNADDNDKDAIANLCHRGSAKALALDTVLHGSDREYTIGDVQIGDEIFGENGKLTKVTHKSEIFKKKSYLITLADGRTLEVSEDHINTIIQKNKITKVDAVLPEYLRRDLTTKELLKYPLYGEVSATEDNPEGREHNFYIPTCYPVKYPLVDLPIDPYTLGLLLGDGSFKYHMPSYKGQIPYVYMVADVDQRIAILQGLMDSNGTISNTGDMSFISSSEELVKSVQKIVVSLGGVATYTKMRNVFRVRIMLNLTLFRLSRKRAKQTYDCVVDKVAVESIELLGTRESQCISVDNKSRTFLANDYVVTHNTTVFGEYFILFCAVYGGLPNFGQFSYGLYVSDSIENGVKKMRNRLEIQCNTSVFLKQVLEDTRFTDTRWYFKNAQGKELVFSGHGAETGVRGTVELRERPSVAIFDDLMSDKNAKSPTIIKSIKNTVYGAVDYALHPSRSKVIWNGTPFNARDPLYQAINSKSWYANVYPVCEEFPVKKKNFRSSWGARFSYEYVNKKYRKALDNDSMPMFNKELLLRITTADEQLVREEDINIFDRLAIQNNKSNYNFYITTDFATTASDAADWSVIMVYAVNNVGAWMLVDGICKKQLMSDNVKDLFRLVDTWNPLEVGVEISGQQGGYLSWLDDKMLERGKFFSIARETDSGSSNLGKRGFKPSTGKLERFLLALPIIQENKFYVARQLVNTVLYNELLDELLLVTRESIKSLHDDAIDTFAQMRRFNLVLPTGGSSLNSISDKETGRLSHEYDPLHDSGGYDPFHDPNGDMGGYFDEDSFDTGTGSYVV